MTPALPKVGPTTQKQPAAFSGDSVHSFHNSTQESDHEEAVADPGTCPLCAEVFDPRRPGRHAVGDHCHKCGEARGTLCGSCNTTLSAMEGRASRWVNNAKLHTPAWRLRAVRYLRTRCECGRSRALAKREVQKTKVGRRPRAT